jgi:dihydrofolate reductase
MNPNASRLCLIAAVARNGAIGRDNNLIWSDPADQRHVRQTTMGCPVVMGRRTWESLPERFRPLPGRRNVVVTRKPFFDAVGAETAPDLDTALGRLGDAPRVFVIGGGELYRLALPRADELVLTEIDAELEGDVFFPSVDAAMFDVVERQPQRAADGTPFAFVTYRRRGTAPPQSHD